MIIEISRNESDHAYLEDKIWLGVKKGSGGFPLENKDWWYLIVGGNNWSFISKHIEFMGQ